MKWGIGNIKGSGGASNTMLTTTTDATENSGTYTLDLTYLSETPKVNDYVAYVNSGAITTLYKVSAIGSTNATLEKIGDIGGGGGKQLYQHNMRISVNNGTNNHTTLILSFYTKIRAIAYENTSDGRLAFIQSMIDGDVYQLMPTSAPMYDSSNAILGYITRAWLDSGSLKLTYTKSDKTRGVESFGYNTITDNVDEVIEL